MNGAKQNYSFLQSFQGLALIPDYNQTGTILRIKSASPKTALRIYYHVGTQAKNYDLVMHSSLKRCYRIHNDRSDSPIAAIVNPYSDEVSATAIGNRFAVQSATGIQTKLTFPYLHKFLEKGNINIHKAELVFTLADNTTSALPPNNIVLLYELNADNTTKKYPTGEEAIVQKDNNPIHGTSHPLLVTHVNNTYKMSVKSYIQALIYGEKQNNGVAIAPYYNSSILNRSIFNSQGASTNPLKLKLYYTTSY
jgi:hypothetical protein